MTTDELRSKENHSTREKQTFQLSRAIFTTIYFSLLLTLSAWAIAIWFVSTSQVDASLLSRLTGQQLTDLAQKNGVNLVIPANPIGISVVLILIAAILAPVVAAIGIIKRSVLKLRSSRCISITLASLLVIASLVITCCGVLVCICFYGVGVVSDLTNKEIHRELISYGTPIDTLNISKSVQMFIPSAVTLYEVGACSSTPAAPTCTTPQLDAITCPGANGDELLNVVNRICSSLPAIGNYPIFTDRCNTCVSRAGSTPASQVACLCGTQLELYLDAISPKQQDKWEKIAIFNGITAAIALVLLLLWICSQVMCPICLVRRKPVVIDTITCVEEGRFPARGVAGHVNEEVDADRTILDPPASPTASDGCVPHSNRAYHHLP